MRLLKGWLVVPVLFVLLAALALPAAARPQASTSTTTADIQRLQDQIYDIGGDLSRLRSRDASTADRLQGQLDTLREEVIYLKVKLRKDGTVSRSEYTDVRDRLDDLRAQARGEARSGSTTTPSTSGGVYRPSDRGTGAPTTQGTSARDNEIPVGTELDVRLQTPLNSDTAQVEDRFEATTMVELANGPKVIIPAGSVVRGVVRSRLWKQVTADVLGITLEPVVGHPGSSLGAAFVAGMGAGVFADWGEVERFVRLDEPVRPNPAAREAYRRLYPVYREIYERLKDTYPKLG